MTASLDLIGALFAVGAALMTAVTSLLLRVGTNKGAATDALVVVLMCNIGILFPLTIIWYYPAYGLTLTSISAFAFAGVLGTMLGRAFYFTSIEKIGASRSDAIKASQPLHATVVALVVLGESLTIPHLAGILLILFGVAAVSWETTSGGPKDIPRKKLLIGLLFPLGASFFYGIEPIFAKIGFAQETPVLVGLTIKTIAATSGFTAYLRFQGALPTPSSYTVENLPWYIAAGVANTVFLGLYYGALELAPVNIVIPMVQTSPFFIMVISYVLLPKLEYITPQLAGGATCVVSGAIIVVSFA